MIIVIKYNVKGFKVDSLLLKMHCITCILNRFYYNDNNIFIEKLNM